MPKQRILKTVEEKSDKMIGVWDRKRAEFFATNPKCKECGRDLDHYSRTILCRDCRKTMYEKRAQAKAPEYRRNYVKKHKQKIQAYQENYHLNNREAISEQKKIKYREKKKRVA